MTVVTIYSKPNCVQCNATYQALERKNIPYRVIDLTQDNTALDFVRQLGYQQVPVVVVGQKHWSGFRPDMLLGL
ncbi:glutaredoxin-like protein NrdH [Moellerella wisconsensis]|uniref:Glutaredoxin-like protein NrdH n=1 Tax=Moellerella wisconsensis ATCC 35017 TaxID=1354267 RepID=A0A0N0I9W1_9GAMM|nr:glutaredoxin-like protein NrdH [Moellerella wisconsensis]KPD02181.1 putative glutaredoxin [Moellerella wisconsensis ATCC 35017]VFS54396.1 Glutaredoxin-like protein nrdH [Moellerella wisconsensis]